MSPITPAHVLTINRVIHETKDARTFELDVPDSLRKTYNGKAGQFLRILIPGDDPKFSRNYSMSSSPELGEPLQFTVKRIAGGTVSERLVKGTERGHSLRVDPPTGTFTLNVNSGPLILIAGGSGVTPVYSLLKTALSTTSRPIALLYANRRRSDVIFAAALEELARKNPYQLKLEHHFSDSDGFLTQDNIYRFVSAYKKSQTYVCGPTPVLDLVEQTLNGAGLSNDHEMIFERFSSPIAIDALLPAPKNHMADVNVAVRIGGSELSFPWCTGTLLDAAISANIPAPFSCREGHCGACKARLVEGEVEQTSAIALSKRDRDRGNILPCCSTPKSTSIVLEYD